MQKVACSLLAFLLASCAASLPYSTEYPLTQEVFRSRDGVLSGRVPQGWFSSTEDTLAFALTAWLIKDDLSASLSLRVLHLDRLSAERVSREGLNLLATISAAFRVDQGSVPVTGAREFEIRGRKYCGYELGDGPDRQRVVLFSARGIYYECEARLVKGRSASEDILHVFSAQQTLLASLTF